MFGALKDKLKGALSSFSEKISKEGKQEEVDAPVEESSEVAQEAQEVVTEEKPKEEKAQEEPKEEKKGFFESVKSVFSSSDKKEEEKEEITSPSPQEETKESLEESPKDKATTPDTDSTKEEHSPVEPPHIDSEEDLKQEQPEIEEPTAEHGEEIESEEDITEKPPVQEPVEPVPTKKEPSLEKKSESSKKEQTAKVTERVEKQSESPVQKKNEPQIKEQEHKEKPKEIDIKDETSSELEKKKVEVVSQDSEKTEEKKGFFSRLKEKVTTTTISDDQFSDMFDDIELAMLENNVALDVVDKIKEDLRSSLVDTPIKRGQVEQVVLSSFKDSVEALFEETFDIVQRIKQKADKPFVISFLGINGSGKTTSIAKMTQYLKDQGFSVVLAAGDTFRAASIEQLTLHADKLGVKIIKHDYGSDPAAVAFDAIKHAQAKGTDVVLIDTAGRMHKNENLMQEMEKIVRVAKPDLKIFVGESITGNDCVEQAQSFNDAVGLDGIILSKTDIDEKGGAFVSVSYVTKKPILFIGTGQEYKDLKPFASSIVMENLGLA